VYVAYDNTDVVKAYSHDGRQVVREIKAGVHGPNSIAIDSQGTVYVGMALHVHGGAVKVYAPGQDSPSASLRAVGRQTIACDANDNVYVGAQKMYGIRVYGDEGQTFLYKMSGAEFNYSIAFDSAGDTYVGNYFGISVYRPGAKKPKLKIAEQGTTIGVAVDSKNRLYALVGGDGNRIDEFDPGQSTPTLTITQGLRTTAAIAIDDHDQLYAANCGDCLQSDKGNITVYKRGQTSAFETISDGIAGPAAIGFSAPYLYVMNQQSGIVTMYRGGKAKLSNSIQRPSSDAYPRAMGFGP
jgi:hypothetical protein